MKSGAHDLPFLLEELRAAGLRVGVSETLRLHRVMHLDPRTDAPRLRRILRAVVAKSTEDAEQVEQVFDRWLQAGTERLERTLHPTGNLDTWNEDDRSTSSPARLPLRLPRWFPKAKGTQRRPHLRRTLALATVLVLVELGIFALLRPPALDMGPVGGPPPPSNPGDMIQEVQHPMTAKLITVTRPVEPASGEIFRALTGLGLLLGGLAVLHFRRTPWRAKAALPPDRQGPTRAPLRSDGSAVPPLVGAAEHDVLVWGIEHFVTEEMSDQLDIRATVAATARQGGRPVLEFHRSRHPREVWLWVDDSTRTPLAQKLADELASALNAAGLVVETAHFRGVPHRLRTADGALFPNELDERRETAIVAILTDGDLLADGLRASDQRRKIEALLRLLSFWPRLAFVDFGEGLLEEWVAPRGLRVVAPAEAPAFLGGARPGRLRQAHPRSDHLVWLAACALCPQGVDLATASALARDLDLEIPPWEAHGLFLEGTMRLKAEERASLLRWLVEAQPKPLAEGSWLRRALSWWIHRFENEALRRARRDEDLAWEGTVGQQRLQADQALLELWLHPAKAISELYSLFQSTQESYLRRHLGRLYPADHPAQDARSICLPWDFADLSGQDQVMLSEMGLGSTLALRLPKHLRTPGRLWATAGLCAGFGLAAAASVWDPPTPPATGQVVEKALEKDPTVVMVRVPGGDYTLGAENVYEGADVSDWSEENIERWSSWSRPPHRVRLSGFWITKYEITNEQYRRFLDANPSVAKLEHWDNPRFNGDRQPVVGVDWDDARTYCHEWAGLDLPTEAQWEAAARGTDQRRYPWGNEEPGPELAHFDQDWGSGKPAEVGSSPRGNGPFGTSDQAGNVWEWCLDPWNEQAYIDRDGERDPIEFGHPGIRVVRGGSWGYRARYLRSADRYRFEVLSRVYHLGFRCVGSVPSEPLGLGP